MIMPLKKLQPYLETLLITLLYILFGYYFFPHDPLFLESKVPFLAILLTLVSLFHGAKRGLFALALVSIMIFLAYKEDFITYILSYLLLVLILGQFFHYWFTKNNTLLASYAYTKERLDQLNHAFYTLKISHDTLEKSYALKPKSIRSSFKEIEELYFKDGTHFENFLQLIAKAYQVEKATISLKREGKFHTIASSPKKQKLDIKDPLVARTLQTSQSTYISQYSNESSRYLCIIPADNQEKEVIALFAIEKMPFLEFNDNNIIAISILFSYFIDQVELWRHLKSQGEDSVTPDQLFTYHYESLLSLKNDYNIHSSSIIIKAKDDLSVKKLSKSIQDNLRALDRFQIQKNASHTMLLLLPLTPLSIADTIIEKVKTHSNDADFEYMLFDINQKSQMLAYISQER